jgi:hypothetical protein
MHGLLEICKLSLTGLISLSLFSFFTQLIIARNFFLRKKGPQNLFGGLLTSKNQRERERVKNGGKKFKIKQFWRERYGKMIPSGTHTHTQTSREIPYFPQSVNWKQIRAFRPPAATL